MISLQPAQVYDTEAFPNLWSLAAEPLYGDSTSVWEISEFRDDRQQLFEWFDWLHANQIPMISYNGESYDYPMIHFLYTNRSATVQQLYEKNESIIRSNDQFAHTIWSRDRFAPQIDLLKLHHFDNKAKRQSLKGLQFNMRSKSVVESGVPFGVPVAQQDVDVHVIPYNKHDVSETKQFALYSMGAIEFRLGLVEQFGVECLSWNDTKVGEKMLERRLGDDVCYDRSSGRKVKRQTIRHRIALRDIIFPYVSFQHPEFQRVHAFMLEQVLTPDDLDPEGGIKTKGVFTGLTASVGGLTFHFGTGGVHASVESQRFTATEDWLIRDTDVVGMYPAMSNVNRLAPEHLGQAFVQVYATLPEERAKYAKGTQENGRLKLAGNAAWGKSNSKFSVFYDSKYAMTIPINGQLMICMLVEWLLIAVPSIRLIQANTDGITYMVHRDNLDACKAVEQRWQAYTQLTLEDVHYQKMMIQNVNNYIAVDVKGKIKLKGCYWSPNPLDYAKSISDGGAWHKDLSALIVPRAAVAAMVHSVPPEAYIRAHTNPFDFMLRAKVNRSDVLLLGSVQQQKTMRYYIAIQGDDLIKISPPVTGGVLGAWKRANGISQAQYDAVMRETQGAWDERVCTKNRSVYEERRTALQAGWKVAECNDAANFRFDNLNYDWYIAEARKLII